MKIFNSKSENIQLERDFKNADSFIFKVIMIQWLLVSSFGGLLYSNYLFGLVSGSLLALVAIFGYRYYRGTQMLRIFNGIIMMMYSVVLIQQNLGSIEMHFHIFVMLSFLVVYKDILPVTIAALFIAIHHLFFTYLQLNGAHITGMDIIIYNYGCGYDIAFLHAFFVVLEWIILVILINSIKQQYQKMLKNQDELNKSNQEVAAQKEFVQTLLDSQEQLIVTADSEKLVTANETFYDFFAVDDVNEFMKVYDVKCICDVFNTTAPEGYLQINMGRESWIDYIISRSFDTTHKVMISMGETDFIFSVTATKLPGDKGLKSAVFTNITDMENAKVQAINAKELSEQTTDKLQEKLDELNRFHNLVVERELVMINLKEEVNHLLEINGHEAKYKIVDLAEDEETNSGEKLG